MAEFVASHASRSFAIELAGPPAQVFPLFEPLGERLWAEGWQPKMLYPPSGEAVAGAVFTAGAHSDREAVWTIVRYEPEATTLSYVVVVPESRLVRIDVHCADAPGNTTRAQVTYTFTALGPSGNHYIATMTEAYYAVWIGEWREAINHYLRTGHLQPHF